MNKYIISQLIMSLLISFHASAMESVQNKEDSSIPVGECYLATMPIEILNYIASFLGWETEEAFIKRTGKYLRNKKLHYCCINSFDKRKVAILNFYHDKGRVLPYLNVFEIKYNKKIKIVDISLPEECVFTALNFNRQGTHLLVRAIHNNHEGRMRKERMMITLKTIDYDKKRDKQNALQAYLRHHLVCKNIMGPH